MLIPLEKTYDLLTESLNRLPRVSDSRDRPSLSNKFTNKPRGLIITDSYNNPFLPIRPRPRIDTAEIDILEVYRRVRELYSQFSAILLPWHFVIEFIENRYYVFSTRPVDMKFPLTNNDVKDRQDLWDDSTKRFMKENVFDISEMIHVLIMGDSSLDVYTKKFYELLGRICIVPFVRFFKWPEGFGQRIFFLNIGHKLNPDLLTKFVRR